MLNGNSLAERLNAVKHGKPIPQPPINPNVSYVQSHKPESSVPLWAIVTSKLIQSSGVLLASFLYGFAINTMFSFDWSLIGCLSVGFLLNHSITIWPKVVKNIFTKK